MGDLAVAGCRRSGRAPAGSACSCLAAARAPRRRASSAPETGPSTGFATQIVVVVQDPRSRGSCLNTRLADQRAGRRGTTRPRAVARGKAGGERSTSLICLSVRQQQRPGVRGDTAPPPKSATRHRPRRAKHLDLCYTGVRLGALLTSGQVFCSHSHSSRFSNPDGHLPFVEITGASHESVRGELVASCSLPALPGHSKPMRRFSDRSSSAPASAHPGLGRGRSFRQLLASATNIVPRLRPGGSDRLCSRPVTRQARSIRLFGRLLEASEIALRACPVGLEQLLTCRRRLTGRRGPVEHLAPQDCSTGSNPTFACPA